MAEELRPWEVILLDRRDGERPAGRRGGERRGARGRPGGSLVLLGLVVCLVVGSAGAALAKDNAVRKLGRGAANLGLGVLALPAEIVDTTRERGPFMGATWGLVKGVGMMVATEAVGLWEILTCPYEFPPDWKPILQPEFPWQRFQADYRERARPAPRPPRVR